MTDFMDVPVKELPWEAAGFEWEDGDPSVGINGGWLHFCTATVVVDNDPSTDISEEWAFDHFEGEGGNRYQAGERVLVCNACGANVKFPERDWDPEYEDETEPDPEYIAGVIEWAKAQEPTVL